MRNPAEKTLCMENTRQQGKATPSIFNEPRPQSGETKGPSRTGVRSRWMLVEGQLKLIWSSDEDEAMRRAA
jgi:hypothetical protein